MFDKLIYENAFFLFFFLECFLAVHSQGSVVEENMLQYI